MKLENTSAPVIYNNTENRHHWQTPRVRVKGSDSRPFILILDWILVYVSSTMGMNSSPYSNLWKAEKLKSQSNLKIFRKIIIQFICHMLYVTNSRKCVKAFFFKKLLSGFHLLLYRMFFYSILKSFTINFMV